MFVEKTINFARNIPAIEPFLDHGSVLNDLNIEFLVSE